ncbi:hypothetical protein E2C01_068876 [Portunus trituberculatus]|uniref:Uncharacterized protein n=1 Tax=Portunus trituberculatus TaxID=210409 RepID=A0A5B7HXQ1_PORTR|nr:hypothetical protein [Portunus trituberculatus]
MWNVEAEDVRWTVGLSVGMAEDLGGNTDESKGRSGLVYVEQHGGGWGRDERHSRFSSFTPQTGHYLFPCLLSYFCAFEIQTPSEKLEGNERWTGAGELVWTLQIRDEECGRKRGEGSLALIGGDNTCNTPS